MMIPENDNKPAWNKGKVIGQKRAFTLDELAQIEAHLNTHCNWHDLALLGFGLDTMFRACDLLTTKVWQVRYQNGPIRTLIARKQKKTKHVVNPVLTNQTQTYLHGWITRSGKQDNDFVFTRSKSVTARHISRSHYADIIKAWAEMLGHDPSEFSSHSIRRSKPAHMYWAGEDIALISRLLGHKSIASTIEYLGITQAKAETAALRHSMLSGSKPNDDLK
ncbi:tyrosine-type recombinase/integrase [Amylibacter sp. SFDW26]|uniref:tyrosine-type recombinase/integrase n=1 Tax=Amylibacter sp. SFDW26 TaxID=2652722 RepID=UPI001261C04C|nr:tyrosine-type recombinase/integrase [Amylibacter sp. SFDW26]KAB7613639.1 tyrosine-type recombinase/integrase [Amylibacter sp. SFDW26]